MSYGPSEQRPSPYPRARSFVLALLGVAALQVLYGIAVFFLLGSDMETRGSPSVQRV